MTLQHHDVLVHLRAGAAARRANATGLVRWDPYPFILLNLILSFQAVYTAPIIMMSQNRLSGIDRQRAIECFEIKG